MGNEENYSIYQQMRHEQAASTSVKLTVMTRVMGSGRYHKRQAGLGRTSRPLEMEQGLRCSEGVITSCLPVLFFCGLGEWSLGGSWLDAELEFGLSIFSKEVLPSILKVVHTICYPWRMVRTG